MNRKICTLFILLFSATIFAYKTTNGKTAIRRKTN